MDRDSLLDKITTEDVIKIMSDLGSDYRISKSNGDIYFKTICHCGSKHKLLYYPDSKMFMCLTECGSLSLYDVIMYSKGCSFGESYTFLCKYKGISAEKRAKGLIVKEETLEDFEFLERHLYKIKKSNINLPTYNSNVINVFDQYYPEQWHDEGLTEEEMEYFGVKMYFNQMKAVLIHRNEEGEIIGIRGRSFNRNDLDNGRKYMPLTIQGLTYRHPTGLSLYGLYENKANIKRIKKVILFEGEKSVIKYGSYFGRENNIALATLGTNISTYQRNVILGLGVNEVIIAYDKQYIYELIDKKDEKAIKEYNNYIKKLIKIYKLFANYCNVSVIFCTNDNELEYKDAPIDQGKETFEKLNSERILIDSFEMLEEELIQ